MIFHVIVFLVLIDTCQGFVEFGFCDHRKGNVYDFLSCMNFSKSTFSKNSGHARRFGGPDKHLTLSGSNALF